MWQHCEWKSFVDKNGWKRMVKDNSILNNRSLHGTYTKDHFWIHNAPIFEVDKLYQQSNSTYQIRICP